MPLNGNIRSFEGLFSKVLKALCGNTRPYYYLINHDSSPRQMRNGTVRKHFDRREVAVQLASLPHDQTIDRMETAVELANARLPTI